jgi:hypothetical protein
MKLLPSDFMHGLIAFTGVYEQKMSKHIAQMARVGGTMVDVGANFGYFSLIWAAANIANIAMAFEASPRNVKFLQDNVDSNRLSGGGILRCILLLLVAVMGSLNLTLVPTK